MVLYRCRICSEKPRGLKQLNGIPSRNRVNMRLRSIVNDKPIQRNLIHPRFLYKRDPVKKRLTLLSS